MPPDDSRRSQPNLQRRPYPRSPASSIPQRTPRPAPRPAAHDAAANLVRNQIDTIYQENAHTQPAVTQAASNFAETSHTSPDSPYDRTHQPDRTKISAEQWKRYHSAWQDYYRQYYERYYLGQMYRMRQEMATQQAQTQPQPQTQPTGTDGSEDANAEQESEAHLDTETAFHDLRADLLKNVHASATKVRRSRHFMPLMAATIVIGFLMFVQYNRVLFANIEAYVSPGSKNPANIIVNPNLDIPVSQDPLLIIPKINIEVPVIYDTTPDQDSQQKAMERGVAWFGIPGANSRPGQIGNTVLSGHSSNDLFDPGDYKFIFARLDQMVEGDTFYLHYEGTRYTYSITKKEVVKPTDVHKLIYDTDKPIVTLITCVPLGTSLNRLLVTAEQVSPDPATAAPAPSSSSSDQSNDSAMPGNSPTLLGRLFGN